jgi:ABC-type Fe3+ transport system permease subunit
MFPQSTSDLSLKAGKFSIVPLAIVLGVTVALAAVIADLKRRRFHELASGLTLGVASLVIGLAMIWFAMPNQQGENPRFLRMAVQMVYPVTARRPHMTMPSTPQLRL